MKKLPIAKIPWPIDATVLQGLIYQTLIQDRELDGAVEVQGIDVSVVGEEAFVSFLVPGGASAAPPKPAPRQLTPDEVEERETEMFMDP